MRKGAGTSGAPTAQAELLKEVINMELVSSDSTILLERLANQIHQIQNMQIALWVLIGLIAVSVIIIVIFIIPLMLQMKRAIAEVEDMSKNLNKNIMPKIDTMVSEAEPVVVKLTGMAGGILSSLSSIIEGIKFVGSMFGRKKKKQEANNG